MQNKKERLVVEVDSELKYKAKLAAAEADITLTKYIENLIIRDQGE